MLLYDGQVYRIVPSPTRSCGALYISSTGDLVLRQYDRWRDAWSRPRVILPRVDPSTGALHVASGAATHTLARALALAWLSEAPRGCVRLRDLHAPLNAHNVRYAGTPTHKPRVPARFHDVAELLADGATVEEIARTRAIGVGAAWSYVYTACACGLEAFDLRLVHPTLADYLWTLARRRSDAFSEPLGRLTHSIDRALLVVPDWRCLPDRYQQVRYARAYFTHLEEHRRASR